MITVKNQHIVYKLRGFGASAIISLRCSSPDEDVPGDKTLSLPFAPALIMVFGQV
jgi:hypothetical protein